MGTIVQCPECDAKNRLQPADAASKRPRYGRCKSPLPWLVDATDASFEREAEAPVPVLVDLWAPWCGPFQAGNLATSRIDVADWLNLADRITKDHT